MGFSEGTETIHQPQRTPVNAPEWICASAPQRVVRVGEQSRNEQCQSDPPGRQNSQMFQRGAGTCRWQGARLALSTHHRLRSCPACRQEVTARVTCSAHQGECRSGAALMGAAALQQGCPEAVPGSPCSSGNSFLCGLCREVQPFSGLDFPPVK